MKKIISAFIILATLMSVSCGIQDGNNSDELFFDGEPYVCTASLGAAISDDYIYYIDSYKYKLTTSNDKVVEKNATRLLKYSLNTFEVSSVCIDPVCTHEFDSDCPLHAETGGGAILSPQIVGDWLLYIRRPAPDIENDMKQKPSMYCAYNTRTGEFKEIFKRKNVFNDAVADIEQAGMVYRDLVYSVVTEFRSDAKDENDTVSYLVSYNVKTDKEKKLFEVDSGYILDAISNKKFYFHRAEYNDTEVIHHFYSTDHKGKCRDDNPSYKCHGSMSFCGTWAYVPSHLDYTYDKLNGDDSGFFDVFDLTTGEMTIAPEDGGVDCYPGRDYLYYITYDDIGKIVSINRRKIAEENPELTMKQVNELYIKERRDVLATGHMYIMRANLDGSAPEILHSYESADILVWAITGKYMVGQFRQYNKEEYLATGELIDHSETKMSLIDLDTGEVIALPHLESVD